MLDLLHRVQFAMRAKGKVERAISYLKDNFLAGRSFADSADLNAQNQHWLARVANVRVHATTKARPDLFASERSPVPTVRRQGSGSRRSLSLISNVATRPRLRR